MNSRFFRFLAAGGIAAIANFTSRFLFSMAMPYVPAIICAYLVGMATAFVLNRAFVFQATGGNMSRQAFWFTAVNLLAISQTVLLSVLFARWIFPGTGMDFHPEAVAHGIGVIIPVFTSYAGHSLLSFRSHRTDASG